MQRFRVSIAPIVRPILLQKDMRSLSCAQNVGACRAHEGGSGTKRSAQELTRRDIKYVGHPAPPGDRTPGLRIGIPTL